MGYGGHGLKTCCSLLAVNNNEPSSRRRPGPTACIGKAGDGARRTVANEPIASNERKLRLTWFPAFAGMTAPRMRPSSCVLATRDRAASVLAVAAFAVLAASVAWPETHVAASTNDEDKSAALSSTGKPGDLRSRMGAKDTRIGAYGGVTYTHPSDVKIANPGRTDMTVKDVDWIGMPFKSPIYYGVRVQRLSANASFGTMVDFTHAKAIAVNVQEAAFEGTRDGKPLPATARIGDAFRHLEFSHGHNMLTWNGLFRMPAFWSKVRPYVGAGAGITLPHTEIGFRDENARTYEYQYAGLVGQVLGGIEINLGRATVFFEYKFSYSPYEVPLSHEPRGFLLFTDLWRQFKAWASGEQPPGGRLATRLATQHAVAGVLLNLPGR
jgi:lipid A oxidase